MASHIDFSKPVTADDVEELFKLILRRPAGNDTFREEVAQSGVGFGAYAKILLNSDEFAKRFAAEQRGKTKKGVVGADTFRVPPELSLPSPGKRKMLLIGSCLMDGWMGPVVEYDRERGVETTIERITINNASPLPEMDAAEAAGYDFQVLQVPMRSILAEGLYFKLPYGDEAAYQRVFQESCRWMEMNLERELEYNTRFGMLTFVLNLATPQQNPMGRLLPRYSLMNMTYFVEELNKHLYNYCVQRKNVHVIDYDQILATLGRRHFQDDSVSHLNHGSYNLGLKMVGDEHRLEPMGDVATLYDMQVNPYIRAIYAEILAAYRSIRQQDSIKIVIFDLDDTLWRGVAADAAEIGPHMIEGWPLGILEAASYLWRRGVLIAIVSKNDEETVLKIWDELYASRFPISNFVMRKINWQPKAQNIDEILKSVNLLPRNALFVDDNPVERAGVKREMPDIRVMDAPLAMWRRILLWSAETQPAVLTSESLARTDMIQAQIVRDDAKASMGREDFLGSLDLKVNTTVVRTLDDPKYARCFELINKTNQYNTTGKRWAPAEMQQLIAEGGYMLAAEVKDRYTSYGIVGVVVVRGAHIEQFVMSCRVFGMDVEVAILARTLAVMGPDAEGHVTASLQKTEKNRLCLNLYRDCGFTDRGDGVWALENNASVAVPAHVQAA